MVSQFSKLSHSISIYILQLFLETVHTIKFALHFPCSIFQSGRWSRLNRCRTTKMFVVQCCTNAHFVLGFWSTCSSCSINKAVLWAADSDPGHSQAGSCRCWGSWQSWLLGLFVLVYLQQVSVLVGSYTPQLWSVFHMKKSGCAELLLSIIEQLLTQISVPLLLILVLFMSFFYYNIN